MGITGATLNYFNRAVSLTIKKKYIADFVLNLTIARVQQFGY